MPQADNHDIPLLCHRCGCELSPGEGNFYVVRIEAFADPTPPCLDESIAMSPAEIDEEIERLLAAMKDMSEQELQDQVYRRLIIHLCGRCYKLWIEDPAGNP